MDEVGETLLAKVKELLAQRPDLMPEALFVAIDRKTPSWRSEFLAGKRTTDSLRLVLAMARFFRVPVGYLLGELPRTVDAATLTLIGAWNELDSQEKHAVMQLALTLSRDRKAR